MSLQSFKVTGMSCASCASSIEKALEAQSEFSLVRVNFASEKVSFEVAPGLDREEAYKVAHEALVPLGYDVMAESDSDTPHSSKLTMIQKIELGYSFSASIIVFLLAMTPWGMKLPIQLNGFLQLLLMSPVFFYVGRNFLRAVWHFLRTGRSTMNTLIGFGTLAAYVYGLLVFLLGAAKSESLGLQYVLYFESIGFIISFVILGKHLEDKIKRRARSGLEALFTQGAKSALLKRGDEFVEVPVSEVEVGDLLRVKPGSKVPVDGKVAEGKSSVDESMLSGESLPVVKDKGSDVFAGTLNGEGILLIRASKVGSETYLSELLKYVENAQAAKPRIQKLADKISSIFVPIVLILAVIVFALWMLLPAEPKWGVAIAHMAAVLVIACPCALGLATPTAVVVALSEALSKGLLVRSAEVLEEGSQIGAVVVDKTGTLTYGKPEVSSFKLCDPTLVKEDLLHVVASLESYSEHPLSVAIVQFSERQGVKLSDPDSFEVLIGEGVQGEYQGARWTIGSEGLMKRLGVELDQSELESEASAVYVARDLTHVATFGLKDRPRENMAKVIESLKARDVQVIMASGDRQSVALAIGKELGLNEVHAQMNPMAKAELLKDLRKRYQHVAMVGDGMNDAAALVEANLSFAMGSGTEAAMQAADVTIVQNDLSKIDDFILLSRKTHRVIRENLFFSFIYNIIGIPLAAGAFVHWGVSIPPAFAGLAMGLSSISVVVNSLRIKRF